MMRLFLHWKLFTQNYL